MKYEILRFLKMVSKKAGHAIGLYLVYFVSGPIFGVILESGHSYERISSNLELMLIESERLWVRASEYDQGYLFDQAGFLVKLNDTWFGIRKMIPGALDMPITTWPIIGIYIWTFWLLVFDWRLPRLGSISPVNPVGMNPDDLYEESDPQKLIEEIERVKSNLSDGDLDDEILEFIASGKNIFAIKALVRKGKSSGDARIIVRFCDEMF